MRLGIVKIILPVIIVILLVVQPQVFAITESQKLTASDAAAGDLFGSSVSVSGDTAIVGAEANEAAYIFERNPVTGVWSQTAKLTASDAAAGDLFGSSVSVSGDTAIVGAPREFGQGSAYVFVKPGTGWADATEDAKLTSSDVATTDPAQFGDSVSISGDTALVGATGAFSTGSRLSGAAYIFVKPGTGWADATEDAKLTASDAALADAFGHSVSISGDFAIVGARFDDDPLQTPPFGSETGSAYIFEKPGAGWSDNTEDQKLIASDPLPGGDIFGNSVSISGNTAIVGAPFNDTGGQSTGNAYIFERDPITGVWSETQKLAASDAAARDAFGFSVSISGDNVIVGASGFGFPKTGFALNFQRDPVTGVWSEIQKLTASDAAVGDEFGLSVSVSGVNGIVGAQFNDDAGPDSGSTYVFLAQPPPVVTVPADITVDATSASGAIVSFTASAVDEVDGPITPTCTPPSGSTFSIGTTTVTCTATDSSGNTGSARFTVTVRDTTPPSVPVITSFSPPSLAMGPACVTVSGTADPSIPGLGFTFVDVFETANALPPNFGLGGDSVDINGDWSASLLGSCDEQLVPGVYSMIAQAESPFGVLSDFSDPVLYILLSGIDSDGDGIDDVLDSDIDTNGDGIPDAVESLLVGGFEDLLTTLQGVVIDGVAASVDLQTGDITIDAQDASTNQIFEINLPFGTHVDGNSITLNAINTGNGFVVEVNGLVPPYPPGKTITFLANPVATSVCIIDSSSVVLVGPIPGCTSTDTSISKVILSCDGVPQTFTGFPESPNSRDYTCTKTVVGLDTFFVVEGLAYSFVSSATTSGILECGDKTIRVGDFCVPEILAICVDGTIADNILFLCNADNTTLDAALAALAQAQAQRDAILTTLFEFLRVFGVI